MILIYNFGYIINIIVYFIIYYLKLIYKILIRKIYIIIIYLNKKNNNLFLFFLDVGFVDDWGVWIMEYIYEFGNLIL